MVSFNLALAELPHLLTTHHGYHTTHTLPKVVECSLNKCIFIFQNMCAFSTKYIHKVESNLYTPACCTSSSCALSDINTKTYLHRRRELVIDIRSEVVTVDLDNIVSEPHLH